MKLVLWLTVTKNQMHLWVPKCFGKLDDMMMLTHVSLALMSQSKLFSINNYDLFLIITVIINVSYSYLQFITYQIYIIIYIISNIMQVIFTWVTLPFVMYNVWYFYQLIVNLHHFVLNNPCIRKLASDSVILE